MQNYLWQKSKILWIKLELFRNFFWQNRMLSFKSIKMKLYLFHFSHSVELRGGVNLIVFIILKRARIEAFLNGYGRYV